MTESSTDYVALLETTFTPPQDQRYTMTATYRATAGGDASVAPYESVKLMCRQQGMNAGGSSYSLSLEPGTKSYILTWEFQLFAGFVTVCGVHGRNAAAPAATVSDIAFTITK